MADTFVSTGTTASFWIYHEGAETQGDSLIVARPVPWANNLVIDQSGQAGRRFSCNVHTTSNTEWANLESLRGGLGTLTWSGGTWGAVLKSVSGSNYHSWNRDCKLEFWLTS